MGEHECSPAVLRRSTHPSTVRTRPIRRGKPTPTLLFLFDCFSVVKSIFGKAFRTGSLLAWKLLLRSRKARMTIFNP